MEEKDLGLCSNLDEGDWILAGAANKRGLPFEVEADVANVVLEIAGDEDVGCGSVGDVVRLGSGAPVVHGEVRHRES